MGMRAPTMMLECDVTLDPDSCAGFAFGGGEADAAYTALCLDARRNMLHYEGLLIEELSVFEPIYHDQNPGRNIRKQKTISANSKEVIS